MEECVSGGLSSPEQARMRNAQISIHKGWNGEVCVSGGTNRWGGWRGRWESEASEDDWNGAGVCEQWNELSKV